MKRLFILFIFLFSLNNIFSSEQKRSKEQEEAFERGFAHHGGAAAHDFQDYEDDYDYNYESHQGYSNGYGYGSGHGNIMIHSYEGRAQAQQQAEPEKKPEKPGDPDSYEYFFIPDPNVDADEDDDIELRGKLNHAVFHGEVDKVRELLAKGYNPNGPYLVAFMDDHPLHLAASKGFKAIVQMLLDAGADPNLVDRDGHTASEHAKSANHHEIAEIIKNYKGNQKKIAIERLKLLPQMGIKKEQSIDHIFISGNSVPENARKVFTALNFQNEGLLLKAKHENENLNAQTTMTRTTPLIYATMLDRPHFVKLLLELGANASLQDRRGRTALIIAAQKNRPDIVRILLKFGADIGVKDNNGKTYLDYAKEHPAVMKVINEFRTAVGRGVSLATPISDDVISRIITEFLA